MNTAREKFGPGALRKIRDQAVETLLSPEVQKQIRGEVLILDILNRDPQIILNKGRLPGLIFKLREVLASDTSVSAANRESMNIAINTIHDFALGRKDILAIHNKELRETIAKI